MLGCVDYLIVWGLAIGHPACTNVISNVSWLYFEEVVHGIAFDEKWLGGDVPELPEQCFNDRETCTGGLKLL